MHLVHTMAYVDGALWHGVENPLTPNQPLEVCAERAGMYRRIEASELRFMSSNAG